MSEIVDVDKENGVIYVIDAQGGPRAIDAPELFETIDWLELAKQKAALLKLIWNRDKNDTLWGLVNLIDTIQEDAETRDYPVVYGYDLEMYKEDHPNAEIPDGPERQA